MFIRGSHFRRHQRYAYLQFITFFSLGPQVSEGSRRAICVNLSDSGMCIYSPDRLRKGQVILFNNPLTVRNPKATVRWVQEYRMAGGYYKSGIMFSSHPEEDSSSRFEQGDPDAPTPEGFEKRSPFIESADYAFPGRNYRMAPGDDFWSDLSELSEREADRFIALTSAVMLREPMKDDVSLKFLRAIAFFTKARIIFGRQDKRWDDRTLDLIEKSLTDFRAVDESADNYHERLPLSLLEENTDTASMALEGQRPGRVQEILGKTKLAYMGDRLYLRNGRYAPSDQEKAIFENIFFHYPVIVRSAEIFYKVLGEPGRRYINVLLYRETSPWNPEGEANDPLCIIGLVEDGTSYLVKDLIAGDTNVVVGKDTEKAGKLPYEKQSGEEARHMKTAWERNDQTVYEGPAEKKGSAVTSGGVPSQAGRGRKKAGLLIAFAILLLLAIAAYFLKFYPMKQIFVPDRQVTRQPQPTAGHPDLSSEPPETRSSLTQEPKSDFKTRGHKARRRQAGKEKREPGKTEAKAEGRIITKPGSKGGTPSPKFRKRSFTPPSREDL